MPPPADSAARSGWLKASATWPDRLLPPLLARVRTRLGIPAELDPLTRAAMARRLAAEAAAVRWDEAAGRAPSIGNDPDVIAATQLFARTAEIPGRH